jgi:hypothetical protein
MAARRVTNTKRSSVSNSLVRSWCCINGSTCSSHGAPPHTLESHVGQSKRSQDHNHTSNTHRYICTNHQVQIGKSRFDISSVEPEHMCFKLALALTLFR